MGIVAAFAVPHPPIILPEVGHGEEKKIQRTIDAYRDVMRQAAELKPDTVVISSPHSLMYADYFHISPGKKASGNFGDFGAPDVTIEVDYDTEFVSSLVDEAAMREVPAGTLGARSSMLDHATMIPLRFLKEAGADDFKVVRIGLSGLSARMHYKLGECIQAVSEKLGRRVVYIASGDLSHKLKENGPYGYAPEGPEFDRICTEALQKGDFMGLLSIDEKISDKAAECGLRSFWMMAGALDRIAVESKLLSAEGPFGVGYGVASFKVTGTDDLRDFGTQMDNARRDAVRKARADEDPWVHLARLSVEHYTRTGSYARIPDDLPAEMTTERAGAFVSLHKDGELRGCIGTIKPMQKSVAEEVFYNAISAAVHDPRFSPVMPDELNDIIYSVDILGAPEKTDINGLDPKQYGVIVSSKGRRGLLLPDLDGIDTVDEQISIARHKAGIGADEPVELSRFRVVRHH